MTGKLKKENPPSVFRSTVQINSNADWFQSPEDKENQRMSTGDKKQASKKKGLLQGIGEISQSRVVSEFISNREVIIEGCKGILEYTAEIVRVSTGGMVIALKGRGLTIKCLTATSITVNGYIKNVEFIS